LFHQDIAEPGFEVVYAQQVSRNVRPDAFGEESVLLEVAPRQAERTFLGVQVSENVPPEAEINLLVLGERGEELLIFGANDEAVRLGDDTYSNRKVSWRKHSSRNNLSAPSRLNMSLVAAECSADG
jgi:hypothetical protein